MKKTKKSVVKVEVIKDKKIGIILNVIADSKNPASDGREFKNE